MYYGNENANDGTNASDVWDNSYVLVQHISETGTQVRDGSTTGVAARFVSTFAFPAFLSRISEV